MTLPAPTYDLMLLLDPEAEEPARAKIVADARAAIEAQGELLRHDEWGERALAYPIDHKPSAEYHLLQFHAATPSCCAASTGRCGSPTGSCASGSSSSKPGTPDGAGHARARRVGRPAARRRR